VTNTNRCRAEFSAEDEEHLTQLAWLTAITLDSLRAHHGDDRLGRNT
jgi:hypothetical protein